MPMPKAYDPQQGYKYQFLHLGKGQREYDHLDYAKDAAERTYLLKEYQLAYNGMGSTIKVVRLPKKYWS